MSVRLVVLLVALGGAFAAGAVAQERLALTTPVVPPSVTEYRIRALTLYMGDASTTADDRVDIDLDATTNGGTVSLVDPTRRETYGGVEANTMIVALNKANLSTRSLRQRIFDRLIADGRIAGSVTGTVP